MKKFLVLLLIPLLYGCEDNEDNPYVPPLYHNIKDNYVVNCPEPPIDIMSIQDKESRNRDEKMLSYFHILQLSDSLFYMYYEVFKGDFNGSVINGTESLCFAYSKDCKNWIRRFPNKSDDNNTIFISDVVGVNVTLVPDKDYPFRMFATKIVRDNPIGLFMWKSKDGIKFEYEKEVFSGLYDTQNAAIVRGDSIKLYYRVWHSNRNRKIGFSYLDLEGNSLSEPWVLQANNEYNPAASYLNSEYDILFPTHFVSLPSQDYVAEIDALIAKGFDSKKIRCNLSKWVEPDELWISVAPGIMTINGDKYIAYITKNWVHDAPMPEGGISKYKLIKIQIDNN